MANGLILMAPVDLDLVDLDLVDLGLVDLDPVDLVMGQRRGIRVLDHGPTGITRMLRSDHGYRIVSSLMHRECSEPRCSEPRCCVPRCCVLVLG